MKLNDCDLPAYPNKVRNVMLPVRLPERPSRTHAANQQATRTFLHQMAAYVSEGGGKTLMDLGALRRAVLQSNGLDASSYEAMWRRKNGELKE